MPNDDLHLMDGLLERLHPALERWYAGDPHGYAELFADKITYFDPRTREPVRSREELHAHYEPIEGVVNFPRWEVLDPCLQRLGEVVTLTYRLDQFDDDGWAPPRWNATEVYRRAGEGWEAVHAHWSAIPEED